MDQQVRVGLRAALDRALAEIGQTTTPVECASYTRREIADSMGWQYWKSYRAIRKLLDNGLLRMVKKPCTDKNGCLRILASYTFTPKAEQLTDFPQTLAQAHTTLLEGTPQWMEHLLDPNKACGQVPSPSVPEEE